MTIPRWQNSQGGIPTVITLVAGLMLGWGLTTPRVNPLHAGGVDRGDESARRHEEILAAIGQLTDEVGTSGQNIVTSGPAYINYNKGSQIQVAQDAVYVLDYRAGKLMAMMPTLKQTGAGTKIIDTFGETDLVSDFKIDIESGRKPHFLMTTGSISTNSSQAFGDGWAPLFVIETTTRQMAAYKVEQKMIGVNNNLRLSLLEVKPLPTKMQVAR